MACTRSATRASKAKICGPLTSGVAKRRPEKAVSRGRCGIAHPDPPSQLYFHKVQIMSPEAEGNIPRLCFRKEYAAGIFADLHDDAEDIRIRTNVKLGVCFLLTPLQGCGPPKFCAGMPNKFRGRNMLIRELQKFDASCVGSYKDRNDTRITRKTG
jgi:hypothetical protein